MAHSSRTIGYVCQSCRKALNNNFTRIQFPRDSIRSFSNSRSLAKSLATFTPTSSPELDSLLAHWRENVFLPSVLSPHHQDLVFKKSRKDILITPPGVSVTVQTSLPPSAPQTSGTEEETIKLGPLNRWDRRNYRKSFFQFTQHLSETSDAKAWDNLIPFLEGLRIARINPPSHFLPRLARRANTLEVARWNTILTAATLSKRTGVTLAHKALTQELVLGVFQRALEGKFSHSEPAKTMERIVMLLDKPEHCGGKLPELEGPSSDDYIFADMRRDATVMALQLAFAAAHALRTSSGQDTDGSVVRCIQRILAIENAQSGALLANVKDEVETRHHKDAVVEQNIYLTNLMPLYTALSLANKVNIQSNLGKEKAVHTHVELQKLLQEFKTRVDGASRELSSAKKEEGMSDKKMRGELYMEHLQATLSSL